MISMTPIGKVHSCYPNRFGTPRQPGLAKNSQAFLEIFGEFQPEISLQGVQEFSHLWVLFYFHQNTHLRFHAKVHPPRLEGETMGLYATRSPHRPNSIGLSLTKIERVEKNGVWVSEVDIIDGTPILDLKPYLPAVEAKPDARMGWPDQVEQPVVRVEWSEAAWGELQKFAPPKDPQKLKKLIDETLCLDPRPLVYKKGPWAEQSDHRGRHAVRFYHLDVHFIFVRADSIVVERVYADVLRSLHTEPRPETPEAHNHRTLDTACDWSRR